MGVRKGLDISHYEDASWLPDIAVTIIIMVWGNKCNVSFPVVCRPPNIFSLQIFKILVFACLSSVSTYKKRKTLYGLYSLVSERVDTSVALILCADCILSWLCFLYIYIYICMHTCIYVWPSENSPSHRIQIQTVPELVPVPTREGPATSLGSGFEILHSLRLLRVKILVWFGF